MKYTVYKITNLVNGKIYIGAHGTENIEDGYMGSGKGIRMAIRRYGVDKFSKDILDVFNSSQEMFEKEAELVDESFVKRPDTYNMTTGGNRGIEYYGREFSNNKRNHRKTGNWGWKIKPIINDELRAKISVGVKKAQAITGNPFTGKKHSDTTKKSISEKSKVHQQGCRNSQFGTLWVTNGYSNKKIKLYELTDLESQGWRKGRTV